MRILTQLLAIVTGVLLALPQLALAQTPDTVLTRVAGPFLPGVIGGFSYGEIAAFIALSAAPIVSLFAMVFIVRAGVLLMISQDEGQISKSRRTIVVGVIAIILVNVAGPLSDIIGNITYAPGASAEALEFQMLGIISWLEVLIALFVVGAIIASGIRAVTTWGSDEGVTQFRRTVISVFFGLLIIILKTAFSQSVAVDFTPGGMIGGVITIMNIILGFGALGAVVMIVIAGGFMVANVGNEEQYSKAKNILIRVSVGLLIIVMSMAIANVVMIGRT